jgi:hypothetical protein
MRIAGLRLNNSLAVFLTVPSATAVFRDFCSTLDRFV